MPNMGDCLRFNSLINKAVLELSPVAKEGLNSEKQYSSSNSIFFSSESSSLSSPSSEEISIELNL